MSSQFKEGDKIKAVYYQDGTITKAGEHFDDITVVMESGQMSGVPWFAFWKNGEIVLKTNGALVESVELPTS